MKRYNVRTVQLDPYSSTQVSEECDSGEWYSVEEVDTEIKRLRNAIYRYGRHYEDCEAVIQRRMKACNCGLKETLVGKEYGK